MTAAMALLMAVAESAAPVGSAPYWVTTFTQATGVFAQASDPAELTASTCPFVPLPSRPGVPPLPPVIRSPAVVIGLANPPPDPAVHVPGVPPAVHTQILPVWSTTKSPVANVPVTGAPEVVAPAYLVAAVAPVRPPDTTGRAAAIRVRSPMMELWSVV